MLCGNVKNTINYSNWFHYSKPSSWLWQFIIWWGTESDWWSTERKRERTLGEARGAQQAFQNIFIWPRCSLWAFQRPWFGLTYWRALPPPLPPLGEIEAQKCRRLWKPKYGIYGQWCLHYLSLLRIKGKTRTRKITYKDKYKNRDFSFPWP